MLLLLSFTIAISQIRSDFNVFQFLGNDSIDGHVSRIVKFNSNGQIRYEELIDYKTSRYGGFADKRETHFYNDTLLVKTLREYPKQVIADSGRIEYKYNDRNKLIQKTNYDYQKRLKRELEFGDCLIDSSYYHSKPTWQIKSIFNFEYDSLGRKIAYYTSDKYPYTHFNYRFQYNKKNNLIKETSLDDQGISWGKFYSHKFNGYDYYYVRDTLSTYNNVKRFIYKYRKTKDLDGNIITEYTSNRNPYQEFRIERVFDNFNRVISEKRYDGNNRLELSKYFYYQ